VLVIEETIGGIVRAEEMGEGRVEVDEGDKPSSSATVSMSVGGIANVDIGAGPLGSLPSPADDGPTADDGPGRGEVLAPVAPP